MENHREFLIKLNALLLEYNASIGWTCGVGSDTHGINDDKIYIDIDGVVIYESDCGSLYEIHLNDCN